MIRRVIAFVAILISLCAVVGAAQLQGIDLTSGNSSVSTSTAHGIIVGQGANAAPTAVGPCNSNVPITGTGGSGDPQCGGTIPVANGGTGDTGSAWTAFTPSLSCGTATFTVNSARYKTMGKTTWAQIDFTITAIGTCTHPVTFTLPNTANSSGALAGRELVGGGATTCTVAAASATATCEKNNGGANPFLVNNQVVVSGVYENQ